MKHKLENAFYFLTLWFSASVIVLLLIGVFFKILKHFTL